MVWRFGKATMHCTAFRNGVLLRLISRRVCAELKGVDRLISQSDTLAIRVNRNEMICTSLIWLS
jgi:hypothetical protein